MHFSFDSLFNTTFESLKLNTEKIDAHFFFCMHPSGASLNHPSTEI